RGFDQRIGALDGYIERLLGEDVQATPCGGNTLAGVKSRGAAKHHHLHRLMQQKSIEVTVRSSAVFLNQSRQLRGIRSVHGGDLQSGGGGGADVSFRDVSAAGEARVKH